MDIFSSIGKYINSVVIRKDALDSEFMLEGLGVLEVLAPGIHKVHLTVEEKIDWRNKFPLFDKEGYGPIVAFAYTDEDENDRTRDVAKQKYGFEKYDRMVEGEYTLFVRWRGQTGVIHVFVIGGEYVTSFQIVRGAVEPEDVLTLLASGKG